MTAEPGRLSKGTRVQLFFGESERVGQRPRYLALLEFLRREGAAGATVSRGVAGFGLDSIIHTSSVLRLAEDLPIVVTWIDAPDRVRRLLPRLLPLAGSGVVTVEDVGVASYGIRRLEQLRFDLKVGDVMTRDPVTVGAEERAGRVAELLEGRSFRAVPVVDADGKLVGIVSNRDLVERAGLAARVELLPVLSAAIRRRVLSGVQGRVVREIMTRDPVTVRPDDSLRTATIRMGDGGLKRLPVVSEAGAVVGMVSRADVLAAVCESFPRATGDAPAPEGATVAGDIARADVPRVTPTAELPTVVDAIVSTRLNRAIVVDDDGHAVGVVSDADVMRALATSEKVLERLMRRAGLGSGALSMIAKNVARTVETVSWDAPIASVAQTMIANRRKVLVVVDRQGVVVGLIDRADLLHAYRDALRETP